jgi:glutamate/tyrosine decarboxylase-like PLP-dependent enzyme
MAARLRREPSLHVLNDVVLNQVLVRLGAAQPDADSDARTRVMIERIQQEGTCWAGGTTWHGMAALRISVSNWSTTESDIDRSAEAIVRAARQVPA